MDADLRELLWVHRAHCDVPLQLGFYVGDGLVDFFFEQFCKVFAGDDFSDGSGFISCFQYEFVGLDFLLALRFNFGIDTLDLTPIIECICLNEQQFGANSDTVLMDNQLRFIHVDPKIQ